MAATVTRSPANAGRGEDVWGRRRVHLFRVTLDSSYPTGGETLGLSALGVQDKSNAAYFIQQRAPLTGGYTYVYDRANDKLIVFVEEAVAAGGPLVEAAAATDLSAVIVDILVVED